MKNKAIKQAARNRISNLIEYAAKYGNKTKIADRLHELTGSTAKPFQITHWLETNPKKWRPPILETFLALEMIQSELCPKHDQKEELVLAATAMLIVAGDHVSQEISSRLKKAIEEAK